MPQTHFTTSPLYTPSISTPKSLLSLKAVGVKPGISYFPQVSHQWNIQGPTKLKSLSLYPTIISCIAQSSSVWGDQESRPSNDVVLESELGRDEVFNWGSEGQISDFNGREDERDEGEGFTEPPEEAKLFVGNLQYDVDSEKLAHIFNGVDVVKIAEVIYNRETDIVYVGNLPWDLDSARVVSDRDICRSCGIGFVSMSSESEVNDAIAALDGQTLDGRAVRVNFAEERQRRSF